MRKEENRFRSFSTKYYSEEGQTVQDGFKEKLLCKVCESLFQKWEDYFARLINQKKILDIEYPADGRKWIRVDGFDYAKTKLFLISILWRIHASKHPRFNVKLGEAHQERIREMLLEAEPGEPEEYGCVIATPYLDLGDSEERQMRPPVTVTPENVRWEHGLRLVRMQIDGMLLQFVIGNLELVKRSDVRHLFLQQSGSVVVGIEDLTKIWFLRNSWGRALGYIGPNQSAD
ncbi:MAG: hypothetical protein R3F03_15400 [Opitutaceae bacterium]